MEVKDARCTNCGASLKVEPQKTITTCEYCHSDILISGAIELALVEVDKTKDLLKYRTLLEGAIEKNSISEILRLSSLIKDIIPTDVVAQYYFSYAKQTLNEPSFMKAFLASLPATTEDILSDIISHMIQRSDLRDKKEITAFLNQCAPHKINAYHEAHESRKNQEDQYANIPRDVFICHSSKDQTIAEAALKVIEKNGYTAWISTRNLRPEDNENYWDNIETAIENAQVLIVISSESAMLSKDVQHELSIARKLKKPMFEYKIDEVPHTALFNHIFNGIKWIDGFKSPSESLNKIPLRLVELIKTNHYQKSIAPKTIIKKSKKIKQPLFSRPFFLSIKKSLKKLTTKKVLIPILSVFFISALAITLAMSGVLTPVPRYTVTFEDYDGSLIESFTVNYGDESPEPAFPKRDGYAFLEWDTALTNITSDTTVSPIYYETDEMVPNGDFDLGFEIWTTTTGIEGGEANFTVSDGVLAVEVLSASGSGNPFEPRLENIGITFEQGKTYEISFEAWALAPRSIKVQVGELLNTAPWFINFLDDVPKIIDLKTEKETYSFKFNMNEETNDNGALIFEMGSVIGGVGTANILTTIYYDIIFIREIVEAPGYLNADGHFELTIEDLAYFDGKDGKDAYVAVDGIVYDMTDSSYWQNGGHNGYSAGQDLTYAINNVSPHGTSFLSRVPQIGIIVISYSSENE